MASCRKISKFHQHTISIQNTPNGVVYDILWKAWFYDVGSRTRKNDSVPFEFQGKKYFLQRSAGEQRAKWVDPNFSSVSQRISESFDNILEGLVHKAYMNNPSLRKDLVKEYPPETTVKNILYIK